VNTAPHIYIDFDDVLCETARGLADLAAELFGTRTAFEDIHSFDLGASFGLTAAQVDTLMHRAHMPDVLQAYAPVPGAAGVLSDWHGKGCVIDIVTGRPAATCDASRAWLERYAIPFNALVYVDKYGRNHAPHPGVDVVSLEQLARMDYSLAIDDAPSMVTFLASSTPFPVAVLERPWNRSLKSAPPFPPHAPVHLCRDWSEIAQLLPE
jgi:uncharacterized protein